MRLITLTLRPLIFSIILLFFACGVPQTQEESRVHNNLRGATSYTPYDALSMLWSRAGTNREVVWTSSGGESGRLLISEADPSRRPDWAFCTQGVVAGLAARGEKPVIIASVHVSNSAILPVFREPKVPMNGARSLFIPKSSIEFAFDRLLDREGVTRDDIRVPSVEKVGFSTIKAMLSKPRSDSGALDFGILVDPFITNLLTEQPGNYAVGDPGLYQMHYSLVVRAEDLETRRPEFLTLLRQMLDADTQYQALEVQGTLLESVWGRRKNGDPERLPPMKTFHASNGKLQLHPRQLRDLLQEELDYLVQKYPGQLKRLSSVETLVDSTLLEEVAPNHVY